MDWERPPAAVSRRLGALPRAPASVSSSILERVDQRCRSATHRWTDRYLHGLYERFGLHGIESIEDEISAVQRWIAQDLGVADDHEDRWFGAMGHRTHLFLEAIADTHFSRWVAPQPDDLTRYADELAALSVERLFAERYGDHGEAKPECDAP